MINSWSIHLQITPDLNFLEKTKTPGESVLIWEKLWKLLKDSLEKLYQNYAQENPKKSIEMLVRFIKTYDINPSSIDLSFYRLEALKIYNDNPQLIQENHEDFLTILSKYLSKNSMIIKDENIDLILKMCKVATEKYNNVISNAGSKYVNIWSAYWGYFIITSHNVGQVCYEKSHYLDWLKFFRNNNHEEYHNIFLLYLNNYLKLVGNISNIKEPDKDFIYKNCEYACQNYHDEVLKNYPDIYRVYDELIRWESIPEKGKPANNP